MKLRLRSDTFQILKLASFKSYAVTCLASAVQSTTITGAHPSAGTAFPPRRRTPLRTCSGQRCQSSLSATRTSCSTSPPCCRRARCWTTRSPSLQSCRQDIFSTTTDNEDAVMAQNLANMKSNAIVGNNSHCDNVSPPCWRRARCWTNKCPSLESCRQGCPPGLSAASLEGLAPVTCVSQVETHHVSLIIKPNLADPYGLSEANCNETLICVRPHADSACWIWDVPSIGRANNRFGVGLVSSRRCQAIVSGLIIVPAGARRVCHHIPAGVPRGLQHGLQLRGGRQLCAA